MTTAGTMERRRAPGGGRGAPPSRGRRGRRVPRGPAVERGGYSHVRYAHAAPMHPKWRDERCAPNPAPTPRR